MRKRGSLCPWKRLQHEYIKMLDQNHHWQANTRHYSSRKHVESRQAIFLWYSFVYLIMRIHVSNITNKAIINIEQGTCIKSSWIISPASTGFGFWAFLVCQSAVEMKWSDNRKLPSHGVLTIGKLLCIRNSLSPCGWAGSYWYRYVRLPIAETEVQYKLCATNRCHNYVRKLPWIMLEYWRVNSFSV